jgi:hypothetical protein
VSCACGVWIYIFRIYIALFYSFLQIHTKRKFCVLLFLSTIWRYKFCPNVVSVVSSFSEEDFPANLTSLSIGNCTFTQDLLEWGLHRLTSLKRLDITGGCPNVESFPEKMLPASLTTLSISRFHNLKYMSSLQSLASLTTLIIYECENLTSFPEDGLPPSLLELYIDKCPLLKEHCKKDHGREWSKIAHIPCVKIHDRFRFDLESEESMPDSEEED